MNWSQIEERWRRQVTRPAELEVERCLLLGRLRARSGVSPSEAKRPFGGWSAATESPSTPHVTEQSTHHKADIL